MAASFDATSAAWLSIGTPHLGQGFVELSALPEFDESRRGDPTAARGHRLLMTSREHAFLTVQINGQIPSLNADSADPVGPRWSAGGIEAAVSGRADGSAVRQTWTLESRGSVPVVRIRVRGRIERPALAEITETDPTPVQRVSTELKADGRRVLVIAPELPAWVSIDIDGAEADWRLDGSTLVATVGLPPPHDGPLRFAIEVAMPMQGGTEAPLDEGPPRLTGDRIVDRAVTYIRECTALRVCADERVILTDHRILPLSWTRDAYWQALALLAANGDGDRGRVADHLRWLWRRCERPDGRWVRSHHANGQRKDRGFQVDQQLYPLLELADYWRRFGSVPDGVEWSAEIALAWAAALEEIDPRTGLIATAENAADDPAVAPFIAASQILLWYTAMRMSELASAGVLTIEPRVFHESASSARRSFATFFVNGSARWPYAVDPTGGRTDYHDANDLPVALAPLWGFCHADDAGWRATMAFAFSSENPGWFGGRVPGLGSFHTPGAWTLGDVQRWIWARSVNDDAGCAAVQRRLAEVAFPDGMLPEAYRMGGAGRIRHWFAWPGAAFAALRILDGAGNLEAMLRATPAP